MIYLPVNPRIARMLPYFFLVDISSAFTTILKEYLTTKSMTSITFSPVVFCGGFINELILDKMFFMLLSC